MKRERLITEAVVLAALDRGERQIRVQPDALITPLAKDVAREKQIAFISTVDAPDSDSPEPMRIDRAQDPTIAIGSDHGGYPLKQELIPFLSALGWEVRDVGTDSTDSCDYPDYAYAVARVVASGHAQLGIMIDGAGIGSAIACSKVRSIRAACAYNEFTAWNARAHNDANVLTLGSRSLGSEVCKRIVRVFLETTFEGGRHKLRVDKLVEIERLPP